MKVYPVNVCHDAKISSGHTAPWSSVDLIVSNHLDHPADFVGDGAEIVVSFPRPALIDSVIVGNTGSPEIRVDMTGTDGAVRRAAPECADGFMSVGNFGPILVEGIHVSLLGRKDTWLGYFYAGLSWNLPRFTVEPQHGLELRGTGDRTFTGQATGVPAETLRNFAVEFLRITSDEMKTINDYVNGVQNVIPHVIDPYPEARREFPPMFATLSAAGTAKKRAENGWRWDASLSWREAR